jgi:predicted pyridoxine 5'-phosphate oxidase superfamily flavin-nucleotide-binding protein
MAEVVPLKLTDEMKNLINSALANGTPLMLATANADGQPELSFRGSLQTFSDTQLGFWLRNTKGKTIDALRQNPKVALMYRSPPSVPLLQFQGVARIADHPTERKRVFSAAPQREQDADPERKGLAIIIDLNLVEGILGFNADGAIWTRMAAGADWSRRTDRLPGMGEPIFLRLLSTYPLSRPRSINDPLVVDVYLRINWAQPRGEFEQDSIRI